MRERSRNINAHVIVGRAVARRRVVRASYGYRAGRHFGGIESIDSKVLQSSTWGKKSYLTLGYGKGADAAMWPAELHNRRMVLRDRP